METSEDTILFNLQFYNRFSFDSHRRIEQVNNNNLIVRSLLTPEDSRLKDPHIGENFNSTYTLRSLFYSRPTRAMIENIIMQRIWESTVIKIGQFLPDLDDYNTNSSNIIPQIRQMAASRNKHHDINSRYIEALLNAATSNSSPTSTGHHPQSPSTSASTTSRAALLSPRVIPSLMNRETI